MSQSSSHTCQGGAGASTSSNSNSNSHSNSHSPPTSATVCSPSDPSSPIFAHRPLSRATTDLSSHDPVSLVLNRSATTPAPTLGSHSKYQQLRGGLEGPRILTCGTRANPEASPILGLFRGVGKFIPGRGPLVLTAEVRCPTPAAAPGGARGIHHRPGTQSQPTQKQKQTGHDNGLKLGAVLDRPGGKFAELGMERGEVREGWKERMATEEQPKEQPEKVAMEEAEKEEVEKEEAREREREREREMRKCPLPAGGWLRLN